MSPSQLKLMAALASLVILVVAVTGVLAERGLRSRELAQITRTLQDHAGLVLELVGDIPLELAHADELDRIADRTGAITRTRVTLIAPDGSIVADSDIPAERLPAVESHATRPEIVTALGGKTGSSKRTSNTVGRSLLYVAVPVHGGRDGVVRIAMDLSAVDAAAAKLREKLLGAAAIGLVAALALSYVLAWVTLRPVREIHRLAAAIAGGDLETRLPLRFSGELGEIARAIGQLAEQLRGRLAETTAEKERLQAVFEGMAEGVLVVDPGGSISLANDRAREFFDISDRVVGKSVLEAVRHGRLAELLARVHEDRQPIEGVIDVLQPVARTLLVHAVPFPSGTGATGTVAVFHDVTELTRLEEMRREFVANASHELRTPLAAIRGFSETLLHTDVDEADRRRYLEIIDRHSRRLGHLVDDLLELSRIESSKIRFDPVTVDIQRLTEQLVHDTQARAKEKNLTLRCNVDGPTDAWADPAAVEQILTNLLDNAIKYTDAGGSVELSIEGADDWLRVRIRDTGIGIPKAALTRIFERFYRVDKARSRELGGTGLGLAIVKHLIQAMGGEIQVNSEAGKGSEFVFTLPRTPGRTPIT